MAHLLDTGIVIDHLANDRDAMRLVRQLVPQGLSMSAVLYMEAYQRIGRCPDPDGTATALRAMIDIVPVLPFASAEARRCADIRESLRQRGRRVTSRALDLMIAATAIEHDLTGYPGSSTLRSVIERMPRPSVHAGHLSAGITASP